MADLRLTVYLGLSDKLTRPLARLVETSGKLGQRFAAAHAAMRKLEGEGAGIERFRELAGKIKQSNAAWAEAQQKVRGLALAMRASIAPTEKMQREFDKAREEASKLKDRTQRLAEQQEHLRDAMTNAGVPIKGMAQHQARLREQTRRATQEVERQKVALEKLAAARQTREKSAERAGLLAGYGYGTYYGGQRAAGTLLHMMEPAKAAQIEEARIRALGMDPAHTEKTIAAARNLRIQGSSIVDNIGLAGDAMSAFADPEHAQMVLPTLAKMKAANAVLFKEDGGEHDKQSMDMLKVIELRGGLQSKEAFTAQADLVQQVLTATRGRVAPDEWRSVIARGGVAAKSMDAQAFFYDLEPLVQDMGGAAVGAGLTAGYNGLYQGRTTKRAANLMDSLGLIADKSKVTEDKAGQIKFLEPGALKGADLFAKNQFRWMEEVLLPTLKERGIEDKQKVLDVIGGIYSNPRGGNLMAQMYLQREQIHRAAARNAEADDIDKTHAKAMATPGGRELDLSKRRDDLYLQLGNAALPAYVALLEVLTKVVTKMSDFAQAHPTLARWLMIGAAGVAAFMVAVGAVLVPLGLMIGQFALLRLGLTYLGAGGGIGRLLGFLRGLGPVAGAAAGKLPILGRIGRLLGGAWRLVLPVIRGFGTALLWLSRVLMATPIGRIITALVVVGYLVYKHWDQIKDFFVQLGASLSLAWKLVSKAWTEFWQSITDGVAAGFSAVMGALRAWWDGVTGFWSALAAPFKQLVGDIFSGAWGKVLDDLLALPMKMADAGREMVMGWVDGFKNAFPAAYEAISDMSSSVVGWFKEKLGIASPSKVFMALGGFIGQGAAQGIEQGQPLVSRAALALAASAIASPVAMAAGLASAAAGLAGPVAGAPPAAMMGGATYSITINAQPGMDPQAIARAVRQELDKRERAQRSRVISQLSDME